MASQVPLIALAGSTARITIGELPEVEMPTRQAPARPRPRNWHSNTALES